MVNELSNPTLTNCWFSSNRSNVDGGAIGAIGTAITLTNCTLNDNQATAQGGGFACFDGSTVTMTNSILWGNTAPQGSQYFLNLSTMNATYNCVEGGITGVGNIQVNPHFVDSSGGMDVRLLPGSPCLDAGNNAADTDGATGGIQPLPSTDLDGRLRFVDDPMAADVGVGTPPLVDMGACEYQADCNDNGLLDSVDLAMGSSPDCNQTWIPDECELEDNDCDSNGIPDECDVAALITEHPQDVLDCPGSTVSFSVSAPGADAYQWYRNGVLLSDGADISGAQADTLILSDIDAADGGQYWCKAARDCIASTSDHGLLTVVGPLAITTQPVAMVRKCNGYTATFTVGVQATAPSFLWHKDGVPLVDDGRISGSETATLIILDTSAADNGGYTCSVWDPCGGEEESAPGVLEIVSPVFVLEPQDTCAELGETAVFTAQAAAPPSQVLGWRWKKNGVVLADGGDISGARTNTLTIANVSASDAGAYSALAFSSNPVCLTDSVPAAFTVGDCVRCPSPGDMDGDGDFDLADISEFTLCFGLDVGSAPECVCANVWDDDDVIDSDDWDELAPMIEGPR